MRRLFNPVFHEGIQIYLIDGQGLTVYFFYLIILALLQFAALVLPTGDPQTWMGPAYLFKFSSVTALLLMVYFGLRLANQEFAPEKFFTLKHWSSEEDVGVSKMALGHLFLLCLHSLTLLFVSLPLLAWAGAVARAPVRTVLSTLLLLLFYSFTYSGWGVVALALWERRVDNRRIFVRWFFVIFVLLSGLLYLPLNPVAFLLYHLGGIELGDPLALWGWKWSASGVHFLFHLGLFVIGFVVYAWSLRRLE